MFLEYGMAAFFEIMVCAGTGREEAVALSDHFSGLSTLHGERRLDPIEGLKDTWWIVLLPKGVGFSVPWDKGYFIESHAECLQVVREIYEHLRVAPPFICALAGWEVEDQLFDLDDGEVFWEQGGIKLNGVFVDQEGAVIPEAWWESMKTLPDYDAASFETFREGLLWSPDLGHPLKAYGRV